MIWLWVLAGLIMLFAALLFSSITVKLYGSRLRGNDEIRADIKALFGIIKLQFKVPYLKLISSFEGLEFKTEQAKKGPSLLEDKLGKITADTVREAFDRLNLIIRHTLHFFDWLTGTLSHVRCVQLKWDTRVGLGDAVDTAITTGMLWGVKSSLLAYVFKYIRLETKPNIAISPQFNALHFSSEATCTVKISVYRVLQAVLMLLYRVLKVKGGFRTLQNNLFKPIHTRG